MALIRMYVYDGTYYQTGLLDTSAPMGAQCLQPDPQSFTSIQQMINYADAQGETIQQVSLEDVNAVCSGQLPSQYQSPGGPGCCICGGGSRNNFVPGVGMVPPGLPVNQIIPQQSPQMMENPAVNTRRIVSQAWRNPLNTVNIT